MVQLKPIKFKGVNNIVSGSGYSDLPTFKDDKVFVSCWYVSFLGRLKFLFTGRIWLSLEHGKQPKEFKVLFDGLNYHQPTSITLDYPFKESK